MCVHAGLNFGRPPLLRQICSCFLHPDQDNCVTLGIPVTLAISVCSCLTACLSHCLSILYVSQSSSLVAMSLWVFAHLLSCCCLPIWLPSCWPPFYLLWCLPLICPNCFPPSLLISALFLSLSVCSLPPNHDQIPLLLSSLLPSNSEITTDAGSVNFSGRWCQFLCLWSWNI